MKLGRSLGQQTGWSILAAALVFGCSADVGGSRQQTDDPGVSPGGQVPPGGGSPVDPGPVSTSPGMPGAPTPVVSVPGGRRVWRLTRDQYDQTVQAVLHTTESKAKGFIAEEGGTGFRNTEATLGFSQANFFEFEKAARELAADTVSNRLTQVFPCAVEQVGDEACAKQFIEGFGANAFRRPLLPEEVSGYLALWQAAKADLDAPTALSLIIEGMLISPSFLFRKEIGDLSGTAETVSLTAYEIAEALSYTLWNGPPDQKLTEAAKGNLLANVEGREAEARRLLGDDRAKRVFTNLYLELLEYERLDTVSKDASFTSFADAKSFLKEETDRFLQEVLWSGGLTDLLTGKYTYVNDKVAALYGLSGNVGASFSKVDLPASRSGILTHPGILSLHSTTQDSSPVRRGVFLLHNLLCNSLPVPPSDVVVAIPPPSDTKTTRERFETQTAAAPCDTCHNILNPPGYLFEHFDAVGAERTLENGVMVDSRATISGAGSLDGTYANIAEFAPALARSPEVRECLAKQNFRYGSGRHEAQADAPTLTAMTQALESSQGDLRELLLSYLKSQAFVERKR